MTEAMSANPELTMKQKRAAARLLKQRPPCVPGTAAIISRSEAAVWHHRVSQVAVDLEVRPEQAEAFFDACGVAE